MKTTIITSRKGEQTNTPKPQQGKKTAEQPKAENVSEAEAQKAGQPQTEAPKAEQPQAEKKKEAEEVLKRLKEAEETALRLSAELKSAKKELNARTPTNPAEMQSKAIALAEISKTLDQISAKKRELELFTFTQSENEGLILTAGERKFHTNNTGALLAVKKALFSYIAQREKEQLARLENAFFFVHPAVQPKDEAE